MSDSKIMTAIEGGFSLSQAHAMLHTKEYIIASVRKDGRGLQYLDEKYKNDKDIVSAAFLNMHSLAHASSSLCDDEEFLRSLLDIGPSGALEYASPRLQSKKSFVLDCVSSHGSALEYASDSLKEDFDVVKAAVSSYGYALRDASEEMQNNKEIVLIAVKNEGDALLYASHAMKGDKDVVLAAVSTEPDDEPDEDDGGPFSYARNDLCEDIDVILAAVRNYPGALEYSHTLHLNKENVLRVVRQNGFLLQYLPEVNDDIDIVTAAIENDGHSIEHASARLRNDKELVLKAISTDPDVMDWHCSSDMLNDRDFVLAALKHGGCLSNACKKLQRDLALQVADTRKCVHSRDVCGVIQKVRNVIVKHGDDKAWVGNIDELIELANELIVHYKVDETSELYNAVDELGKLFYAESGGGRKRDRSEFESGFL